MILTLISERLKLRLMHDEAPVHFAISIRQYLDKTFPERWIGRDSPVKWTPRSLDLNLLDLFWRYLKNIVYFSIINDIDKLKYL